MSYFEYYCTCGYTFEIEAPIGQPNHPKTCPQCNGLWQETLFQDYKCILGKGFIPVTTMMQQSDINKKRTGKFKLEEMEQEYNKKGGEGKGKIISETQERLKKEIEKGNYD